GRAVDFVGEHQVGENRPELAREVAGLLVVDGGADQVGGQQVGGELYARKLRTDGFANGSNGQRLSQARYALEQDVTACQQADEQAFDHVGLAYDDLPHLGDQIVDEGALLRDHFVHSSDVLHRK